MTTDGGDVPEAVGQATVVDALGAYAADLDRMDALTGTVRLEAERTRDLALELASQIDGAHRRLADLRSELDAEEARLAQLRSTRADLERDVTELDGAHDRLQGELAAMRADLAGYLPAIDALRSAHERLDSLLAGVGVTPPSETPTPADADDERRPRPLGRILGADQS